MSDRATLYGSVAQIAVLDPGTRATLYGSVAQVAALDPGTRATLYGSVAQVAALDPGVRATLYGSVAQVAALQPTPVASLPNISGPPGVAATFDGSASQNHHYYKWAWTSLPGGTAISNFPKPLPDGTAATPVALPDSQAGTPVNMTDNVLLMHMNGNADDSSGEGNDGTIGSATLVSGRVGSGAYQFNGTSDVITIANTADLSMGAGVSWSVCAWVKPTMATTGYEGFLYHGAFGANQILFARSNTGYFTAGNGGSGTWQVTISDQFLYSNVWYHLAAVVDRSANTITLYVNGRQVKTQAWTFVPSSTTDDSTVGRGYGAAETFGGVIDELAVWRRALSASEIQGIYDLQKGWETATTPVDMEANEALYHFEGNLDDNSGAGRNLTAYNSPTYVTGKIGSNAIEFNGTNQYAQATVPVSTNGSIACWLQLTDTPTNGDVFVGLGVNTSSTNGTWRSISWYNGLSFFGRGSGNEDILTWGGALTVGQWYHVIITWNSAKLVSCYLDGVLVTSETKSGLKAPASELSLAARLNAGTYYAPCKLDEVAVWSQALSASEVAAVYSQVGSTGLGISTATATFTPDVAGTYTVQLTVADGVSTTANAVISVAGGDNKRAKRRKRRTKGARGRGFSERDVVLASSGRVVINGFEEI